MSCGRMEKKIMGYVDGRLKEGERLEMEKHLSTCAVCGLSVNEFRAVNVFLDDMPMIEPSAAFDVRLWARVAAGPAKQSWWAWFAPSPRVAFAASMLVLPMMRLGSRQAGRSVKASETEKINHDMPARENIIVLSTYAPL